MFNKLLRTYQQLSKKTNKIPCENGTRQTLLGRRLVSTEIRTRHAKELSITCAQSICICTAAVYSRTNIYRTRRKMDWFNIS